LPDSHPSKRDSLVDALSRIPGLAFRSIAESDRPFLAALYAQVRRDELAPVPWPAEAKAAFLADQFRLQHAHYTAHYPDAEFLLVEREQRAIGRVYVSRGAGETRLMEISLLEAERGKGFGGAIIDVVLREAQRRGDAVTLHVEPNNPALRLYERLGFVATGPVAGVYLPMRWSPVAP
jgi:ribosomal protein S18 acetylase RimI-like enzyme